MLVTQSLLVEIYEKSQNFVDFTLYLMSTLYLMNFTRNFVVLKKS